MLFYRILVDFSVWMLISSVRGQKTDCSPDGVFAKLIECSSKVIPDPNHPMYAPIIGGGDILYARDMCRDKGRFEQGFECFNKVQIDCSSDKRVKQLLTSFYNRKNVDRGTNYFCNRLKEHDHYAECYFDHSEALWDCVTGIFYNMVRYFTVKGPTDPVDNWIKTACSGMLNITGCQYREMLQICGSPAATFLRTITLQFKPDVCGGIQLVPSVLLLSAVIAFLKVIM